ncbi:MAG: hypothetical protein HYZ22_01065 [Chloroflexi bacterium]|nr:hypothetical protein [Chloroflexota bacterium]
MKKLILPIFALLVACAPMQISSQPTQISDQYPTLMPTPTLAVLTREIDNEEKEAAFNFLYEMKNNLARREYEHFAEEIRYPITVNVEGQPKTFIYMAEFEDYFEKIFSEETLTFLTAVDETELTFTSEGVKVGNGIIWFDLICQDLNCDEAEFMVTQINN